MTAMKGFDANRPGYDCFISMTISVAYLSGFSLYPTDMTTSGTGGLFNGDHVSLGSISGQGKDEFIEPYRAKIKRHDLVLFTTHRKRREGSIEGWEYYFCNTSLLSGYENYCIIIT